MLNWKGTVTHNSYSGNNSRNPWRMPLNYLQAFELSVELQIEKFTGRHLSRVSLVQVISYELCKTFKKSYFEEYLWTTAAGCRLDDYCWLQAGEPCRFLKRRDLLLLLCLAYIKISVGTSFFFFYLRFLYAYLFWFLKVN